MSQPDRKPKHLLVLTPIGGSAFVENPTLGGPVVVASCGHECVPSAVAAIAMARDDIETTTICHNCVGVYP